LLGIIDRRGAIRQVRAMAWSDAEEVSAVLSAYVLIQTEVGKVARIQVVDGVTRTLTCTVLHR
jgi:hypothetical protein